MKLKTLFNSLSCLFIPGITATDNGVMITGDGSVIMEKLGKISTAEDMSIGLYYIDVQGFLEHPEKDWEESLSAMMESPPEAVETEK